MIDAAALIAASEKAERERAAAEAAAAPAPEPAAPAQPLTPGARPPTYIQIKP